MREIKFRAWDKVRKEYLSGGQVFIPVNPRSRPQTDNTLFLDFVAGRSDRDKDYSDRFIIQQFTGLKDENGVEIYEGDILEHDSHEYLFEIKWYPNDAAWRFHRNDKGGMGMAGINELWKIIGNIYENPELINKVSSNSGSQENE